MQTYKRGNVWWVSWYSNGIRHRKALGVYKKSEVEKALRGLNLASKAPIFDKAVEILRLFFADENAATEISTAWDKYIEMISAVGRDDVAKTTLEHRRQYFRRFTNWLKERRKDIRFVESVDAKIAADFAKHLTTLKNQKGQPISKKTRKEIIDELGGIWKILGKVSSFIGNPWTGLAPTAVSAESKPKLQFTKEQEDAVMSAAKRVGKGWHLACLIARHTGMRYGDVANLEWEEVFLDEAIIRYTPNKTRKHNTFVEVPIVGVLLAELKKAKKLTESEYVLPNHMAVYQMNSWERSEELPFREVLAAAGIEGDYSFHSWRKTTSSRLGHVGADKETRKQLLGHTTDSMAEHYDQDSHIEQKRRALEAAAKV